jgi:hypothetical protein
MTNVLSQAALRRLMRHHARLEGAQSALQAVDGAYKALASNFEDALRSACEDASIDLPPPGEQAQIHVDWNTGDVSWQAAAPESTNGQVQEVPT